MKLRNLIFALFLVIGAIGFVSCTGDDGATGPQGPQGEQGPKGDPGDGGAGGMATYDFLKAWGSETGTIGCDDPLLTGMGDFPGSSYELKPILNAAGTPTPASGIVSRCNNDVLENLAADAAATLGKMVGLTHVTGELVFIKSEQLIGNDAIKEQVETDATATKRATRTDTTKMFVGGSFFADMSTTGGNDESGERAILYSNCTRGTAPSALRGAWRAVEITEVKNEYTNPGVTADDTMVTTTTTKVCLRLDSVPGTVKCFIETHVDYEDAARTDTTVEQIAVYDGTAAEGMMIMPVAPKASATTGMLATPASPTGAAANGSAVATALFGNGNDLSDDNVAKLCALFEEAGAAGE